MNISTDNALTPGPLKRKFVARQPIFDRQLKVVGYELLFRTGFHNVFDEYCDQDLASSKTLLDSFLLFGLNELAGGKRAFINFTKKVLLSNVVSAFPSDVMVIELLENIEPDRDVIAACRKLKDNGYVMALDDFVYHPQFAPLLPYLDIIKVDFKKTRGFDREKVIEDVNRKKIQFLAEKVESIETFKEAAQMGYTYFQGFFFSKPVVVSAKDMPSLKTNLLRLLDRIYEPEIDFAGIESIVKKDVSLSYKLVRFINSAAFGLPVEVRSIMHVLNLLGVKEFRKWVSLVVLSQLSNDKPEELMVSSVIRARLSELIAETIGMKENSPEFFLMGLFSLIDVFLERTMEDILKDLPLSANVKDALLHGKGVFGEVLRFVTAYEKGNWNTLFDIAAGLKLDEERIPELYFDTITWANALKL
jgi:EAL and modified HD-GYP domain-containing signal transduction protein